MTKLYVLRHKESKKLMGFSGSSNSNGNDCGEIAYYLNEGGSMVWTTRSREIAEKAAENTNEWYNADIDTPENEYIGKLEVIELGVGVV